MEKLEKKTKKELVELVEAGLWYEKELLHMYNVIACNHIKIKEYKPLTDTFIQVIPNLYINYCVNEKGNIYVNANKVYKRHYYDIISGLEKGFERINISAVDALINGFDMKSTIIKKLKKTNASIRIINGTDCMNYIAIQDNEKLQIIETKFINLSK